MSINTTPSIPYDLKDEEQVKKYLANLYVEFNYQCNEDKLPNGCHRLGDLIELVRKDFTKAGMVYKMNCDEHKYGPSCYKYAQYNLAGRGREKNLEEGLKYHSIGCELGYTEACHIGGMLHMGSIVSDKSDPIKGADFLARACEKKYSDSCARLGESYLTGKKQFQQDKTKAFEYIKKACELENFIGCVNLSVMYKKGDGVTQNFEMAEMFKQKAQTIYDSMTNPKTKLRFGE
ncbi:hypothetical protein CHS0354_011325 [Potamilus streckersoni]|uniref:Cytochrome c oxidase assembly factor 7 homolog n=1 Tax=Potamilus streckersoni TaxID=2493646 RepID=A0AAE0WD82_9BIVA|nr:hypothetical protein CHS0354_011325 [Potamilus streckersoni]